MRTIDADVLLINLDGMMAVSPTGYIHGDTVADMISDAQTVDSVPVRQGEWEWSEYVSKWKCSNCWHTVEEEDANTEYEFCPYCGAKMDG